MTAAGAGRGAASFGERVDWRQVADAIVLAALVAIVVPFVLFAAPQVVGAQHSYVVLSGSMQPAMQPGDVIFVEDVDPSAIRTGDVITFTNGDELAPTTHRVVEVVDRGGEPAFRTKGDANDNADRELVPASRLEGRVPTVGGHLLVIPAIGYVIEFAGTELGFTLLVAVPIALFAALEIRYVVETTRGPAAGRNVAGDDRLRSGSLGRADDGGSTLGGVTPGTGSPVREGVGADDAVTYTLQPNEIRLGLAALVPFAAYSVWVASGDPTAWTVGVAAAVCVATLLLAALYVFGGSTASQTGSESATAERGRSVGRQVGGGEADD